MLNYPIEFFATFYRCLLVFIFIEEYVLLMPLIESFTVPIKLAAHLCHL
jgi:hypothetical protein